jgi:hypothetical protein
MTGLVSVCGSTTTVIPSRIEGSLVGGPAALPYGTNVEREILRKLRMTMVDGGYAGTRLFEE